MRHIGRPRSWFLVAAVTATAWFGGVDSASAATFADDPFDATVPFVDSFNNNRLTGWHPVDQGTIGRSAWRATGQQASQTRNVYGGSTARNSLPKPGTVLFAGDSRWTDIDLQLNVTSHDDDAVGVVFGYRDPDNFYRFSMDRQRNYRRLVAKVGGHYHLVAEAEAGYRTDHSYRLRIRSSGGTVTVSLDGRRVLHAPAPWSTTGRIGLYTWGNPATFDDVALQASSDYFTIAVVPDTQFETATEHDMIAAQMSWLASKRAPERIALVLHEGDVVNRRSATAEWDVARSTIDYLDGKVPFVVAAGNHDVENTGGTRPLTKKPERFNKFLDSFADYTPDGFMDAGDYRNTYHLLRAGGVDLLVINLDFGPEDDVLAWAGRVADRYPARHVILLTHDYLGSDGELRGTDNLGDRSLPHNHNPAFNDGVGIWEKLVTGHPNVQFVLNGHVIQPVSGEQRWSVARRTTPNDADRPVYQMLTNFQTFEKGGGYLKLLRVYPSAGRVEATTYSPYGNVFLTDDRNQFTLEDVDLRPW